MVLYLNVDSARQFVLRSGDKAWQMKPKQPTAKPSTGSVLGNSNDDDSSPLSPSPLICFIYLPRQLVPAGEGSPGAFEVADAHQ
jgi:hypothetical protein